MAIPVRNTTDCYFCHLDGVRTPRPCPTHKVCLQHPKRVLDANGTCPECVMTDKVAGGMGKVVAVLALIALIGIIVSLVH